MTAVVRRILFLASIVVAQAACDYGQEMQWYKPGGYSMAEFDRDKAECTKDKALVEECMKDRGWVAITADTYKAPPMQGGPSPSKPRSAPK